MERARIRIWLVVTGLALGRVAFGFQFQSLPSLGPELVRQFGLDYATLGTLIGLYLAPGIVIALPGGLLGRRYGERWVMGGGFLCMIAGALLAASASGPGGIGAGRLLAGAGAVALAVMQGKMVSDRFSPRGVVLVMGVLVAGFPVGVGLAGLVLAPVLRVWGWPGMFGLGAGLAALAMLALLPVTAPPPARSGTGWQMPSRRECALVMLAGAVWSAYNAGYYGFLSYVPSLLAARGHPDPLIAGVLTMATWLNLPATLLGGWLAGRHGNGRVFVAGTLASVLAVAGPALADWPLLWGALFGTLASLHAGVIVAVGTLSARPENRAAGMGLFYTVYYAGGTVFPALCGRAADLAGTPAGALLAAAALGSLGLPAFAWHQRLAHRWSTGTRPGASG